MNADTNDRASMTEDNTVVLHVRKDTPKPVVQATMDEIAKRNPGVIYFVVVDDGEKQLEAIGA